MSFYRSNIGKMAIVDIIENNELAYSLLGSSAN